MKSTAPHADLDGEQLIEWGAAQRWVVGNDRCDPARLRAWARSYGGHATLFRAADKAPGAFDPLSDVMSGLHQRLKAAFDPAGIFNRGRLYPTF